MQTPYGRVAIVVAASDGVGAAIARCFGELGASVVVNYASDKAGAERVVAEIVQAGGAWLKFSKLLDLNSEGEVRRSNSRNEVMTQEIRGQRRAGYVVSDHNAAFEA